MTYTQNAVLFLIAALLYVLVQVILTKRKHRRFAVKPRVIISEPRIKIMYNPFKDSYMWVRLNPATRTWEWEIEATPAEVKSWYRQPESVRAGGVLIEKRGTYVEEAKTAASREIAIERTESSRSSNGNSEAAESE